MSQGVTFFKTKTLKIENNYVLRYLTNHRMLFQGEGFFGTVYEAQAHGITIPNTWSTVAVKMVRGNKLLVF